MSDAADHDDLPAGLAAAALEWIDDAVLVTDAQTDPSGPRIVYANASLRALTGYGAAELTGAGARMLAGPDTDRDVLAHLRDSLAVGEACSAELVNYRRDGTPVRLEWRIQPLPAAHRGAAYLLGVARDVTEAHHAARRRRQLEALARIQHDIAGGRLDEDAVRERIAGIAQTLTGADGAAVAEPEGGDMVYRAAAGSATGHLGLRLGKRESLSGLCYRRQEVVLCTDVATDERIATAARPVAFRSAILVPLVYGYRCFGVLEVFAAAPARFGEEQRALLELASSILAAGLGAARAYSAEIRRRSLLVDALPMLVAYVDRDGRYREVNAAYEQWFGTPRERIVGREIRALLGDDAFAAVEPYVRRACAGQAVHYETRVRMPWGEACELQGDYVPDRDYAGRVRGFFALVRDVTHLQGVYVDYLTHLYNRRKLEKEAVSLIDAAKRYARPLSAIMMDIDDFKAINDRYGHAAGDDVLREVARLTAEIIRTPDLLARWGGEEFVLMTPETGEAEAAVLAERIRARIAGHAFAGAGRVTASFGVAELTDADADLAALQARADAALYAAKHAGRDCVIDQSTLASGEVEVSDRANSAIARNPS